MSRRLIKELASLHENPLDFCTVQPIGDNILKWNAMIMGDNDTPYADGIFNVDIDIGTNYPFEPPKVKFTTKIYHPNIKSESGEICSDLLKDKWAPTCNIRYVMGIINGIMNTPNLDDPLEADIAQQYNENYTDFVDTAQKWTKKYAV